MPLALAAHASHVDSLNCHLECVTDHLNLIFDLKHVVYLDGSSMFWNEVHEHGPRGTISNFFAYGISNVEHVFVCCF